MPAYREGQRECIEFIVDSFNTGKRIVIVEAPTGSGKSAIGLTIGRLLHRAYYVTISKVLQDQMMQDFGDDLVELKGRSNYSCTHKAADRGAHCGVGFCKTKLKATKCSDCFLAPNAPQNLGCVVHKEGALQVLPVGQLHSACPYYEQIGLAMSRPRVLMNFASFLHQTNFTPRFFRRDLLVCDEAHNSESQLLDFISFVLGDRLLRRYGIEIRELASVEEYLDWFDRVKLPDKLTELTAFVHNVLGDPELAESLDKLRTKCVSLRKIIETSDCDWVAEFSTQTVGKNSYNQISLKPVFVSKFAHSLLFRLADRVLLMSATILDVRTMSRSLGLKREDVAAYRMKNRFPPQNRPIYNTPAAKITGGRAALNTWGPILTKKVGEIVRKYPDVKGIIHTHNSYIMNYIIEHSRRDVAERLLCQTSFNDKFEMLEEHKRRANSVLIAPAMHEGINLIGDLSRFQLICKCPYGDFYSDKQLARRMEVDPIFYDWQVAQRLVQAYGRSIRSETDWADTYLLDSAIMDFVGRNGRLFPSWFTEAIVGDD